MKLDRFAKDFGKANEIPAEVVKKSVLGFLDAIKRDIALNNSCLIAEFGSFKIVTRKEKAGLNISTRERITIPEHDVVKFNPSTLLLGSINGYKVKE